MKDCAFFSDRIQWMCAFLKYFFLSRELQAEHQHSQSFQEKCKNLTSIQTKLEEQFISKKDENYSSLQEMLTVHQVQHTLLRH